MLRIILVRVSALIALSLLLTSIALATAETSDAELFRRDGLSAGNSYEWTLLRGTLTVHCSDSRGGPGVAIYSCYRSTLDPSESAYFVTSPGGNASSVTLNCLHEDGTSQKKRSGFSPGKGQSTNWFNLWISTLFQRPLLKPGINACTYELSREDGTPERSGGFEVNVAHGASRSCPARTIWSRDPDDCTNGSLLCEQYFSDLNYCQ